MMLHLALQTPLVQTNANEFRAQDKYAKLFGMGQ